MKHRIPELEIKRWMVEESEEPALSVVIVVSRPDHEDWLEKARDSLRQQLIRNVEVFEVDNRARYYSLGYCWNRAVEQSKSKWVYFLGDDDFLSRDYLISLLVFSDDIDDELEDVEATSTHCTFFNDDGEEKALVPRAPTGMWKREVLLEHPINEHLTKWVDIDMHNGTLEREHKYVVCPWLFGYFYRQHDGMMSGRKKIPKADDIADKSEVIENG